MAMFTTQEAADRTGVEVAWIANLSSADVFKTVKPPGGRGRARVFDASELRVIATIWSIAGTWDTQVGRLKRIAFHVRPVVKELEPKAAVEQNLSLLIYKSEFYNYAVDVVVVDEEATGGQWAFRYHRNDKAEKFLRLRPETSVLVSLAKSWRELVKPETEAILKGARAIAERLETTPRQIYALMETGRAPFIEKVGGRISAKESAIDRWIETRRTKD
jgi:predicted DNA-binding transcriptional regulator AlpA